MLTTYEPHISLQPYITHLYSIKWERSNYTDGITEMSLPSGTGFMVFQFTGRFKGSIYDKEITPDEFYTIGQQTAKYILTSDDEVVELTGAVFNPTGLYKLFGFDMLHLVNNPMDTRILLNNTLKDFTFVYKAKNKVEDRVQLVENLLLKQLKNSSYNPCVVDTAITLFQKGKGCCSVKEIAEQLNISERYLQKKFKLMVGITPSSYNRIVRFNYLFAEMQSNNKHDYKTLSALFNFYDFAHFSKDFKRYCGESPSKFHLEQFQFLKEAWVDSPFFINK